MYISMQETIMNVQNEIHAYKERELDLRHTKEIHNIEIKSLKEELHAMKHRVLELEKGKCLI